MPQRTYDQEEVDAILDRALRAQAKDGTRLTHDELVEAAAEVGIPKEAIDAAARPPDPGRATDAQLLGGWKRRARLAFARHFVVYVLVIALLALVNFLTTPGFPWFGIPALGWGIGIAMHFMSTFFPDEERVLERERRRLDKRARRERWRRRSVDFERAVDEGVKALLDIVDARAGARGPRVDTVGRVRVGDAENENENENENESESETRGSRR